MQLLSPFVSSLGMYSGHEAQLYKLQENLGGKLDHRLLHIISNDENITVFDT